MNIGSGMILDRTIQPKVRDIEHLAVQMPQRCTMPNGVSLNVLDSGDNEVVRIDLLMEGGRWQQSQPLQALFTNRMLREGTLRYSAGGNSGEAGLLRCLAGVVQRIGICVYYSLFAEQIFAADIGNTGIHRKRACVSGEGAGCYNRK